MIWEMHKEFSDDVYVYGRLILTHGYDAHGFTLNLVVGALTLTGLTVVLQLELCLPRNGYLLSSIAKG